MKKLVIGHKSPDTDSVVSTIVFNSYLKKKGIEAEAVLSDKINRETKFVLNFLKVKEPRLIKKAPVGTKFYLVDHGELSQSVLGLKEEDILGVVDHHKMGGLKTIDPIFYRSETVGSTSTLIASLFEEKGWSFDKKIAGLLSAGIISDTLNLISSTTTAEDKRILKKLSQLAGLAPREFSQKMFLAKSDIRGMDLKKILTSDYKEYEHNGQKIGIGVVETVSPHSLSEKKEKIFEFFRKNKKEKGINFLFFGLVDIFKRETFFYLIDKEEVRVAQKAFNLPLKTQPGEIVTLKGVTSRKKEILPFLLKAIDD